VVAVVATWLLAAVIALGLGLPISCRLTPNGPSALRGALWLGLFIGAVGLAAVNLVTPLRSPVVAYGIAGLALVGLATSWPRMRKAQWTRTEESRWWFWGIGIVAVAGALGWSIAATYAPTNYDTGLYHLNAIEYAAQAATVPGLANLFGPLGFSTVMMPLAAAFTNGPLGESGYVAVNGFLLLLLPVDVLLRLFGQGGPSVGTRIVFVGTIAVYPPLLWNGDVAVTSPATETAALVLALIGVAALADAVWRKFCTPTSVLVVVASLSLAAAIRPQAWVMVVGAFLVLARVQWRDYNNRGRSRKVLRASLALPVVVLAVGAVRDIRLSGWLFYPLDAFPIRVSWIAEEARVSTGRAFTSPARGRSLPEPADSEDSWLAESLAHLAGSWELWLLAIMLLLGLVLLIRRRSMAKLNDLAITTAPGIASIALWLVANPTAFRFDWDPWFSTAAVILGWGWMHYRSLDPLVLGVSAAGVAASLVATLWIQSPNWPVNVPNPEVLRVNTPSGLGFQLAPERGLCWDAFPECSQRPSPGALLRGGDWRSGYSRHRE